VRIKTLRFSACLCLVLNHPALQSPPAKTHSWSGPELVLKILREGLNDQVSELRYTCIESLAATGDLASAPAIRQHYQNEAHPTIRAMILRALGAMKDTNAIPLIAEELKNESQTVTLSASVDAAEQIGGEASIRGLIPLLTSRNVPGLILSQAIIALGNLQAKSALVFIEKLTNHPVAALRAATIKSIGKLQGEASLPLLEAGLTDPGPEVRFAAVKALSDLKSSKSVASLLAAYAQPKLRDEALVALVRTPDERAIDPFLDGLSSRNPAERNASHLAILSISDKVLKRVESRIAKLPPLAIIELRHIYAGNKQAEDGPIFAKELKQHSLKEYMAMASKPDGDPVRGQKHFSEPGGINCIGCHRVSGLGNDVGPDLSSIGVQFDRKALAEAILFPSKTVREGYQQIVFQMADEEEFSGVVKAETAETLTIRDAAGRDHKLTRSLIRMRRNSMLSLMPDGLQAGLSLEEFSDLMAYLASLKDIR
jgi:quinoprotein glucose dehydrogenase